MPRLGEGEESFMVTTYRWFSSLSGRQKVVLSLTVIVCLAIIVPALLMDPASHRNGTARFTVDMPIRQIAPRLGVTGKALARELGLPLSAPKNKPLGELGVTQGRLSHATGHLLSHADRTGKYWVFLALALAGFVYLNMLGRPDGPGNEQRNIRYPRSPYLAVLTISVLVAGFYFGKSPNPMESIVKVFKSLVGLYPDPAVKVMAFLFFAALAVAGSKIVCGWACPFGALQELIYSIPLFRRAKRRKPPFAVTNAIRIVLFLLALLFLFGVVGGGKGFVLYHYINPFNLFNMDLEGTGVLMTVILALAGSFFMYRPFCQLVCPFGLVSWILEGVSITRVRIDRGLCTRCGACTRACPLPAAADRVQGRKMPADCFSCGRCLNVCPEDAIRYGPVFRK